MKIFVLEKKSIQQRQTKFGKNIGDVDKKISDVSVLVKILF